LETKRSENAAHNKLGDRARSIARSTGVHKMHRPGLVDRAVDRGK